MKKFIYNEKESYTLDEVKTLLSENERFARKGYVENSDELKTQLKEYGEMKKATEMANFNKDLTTKLEKHGVTSPDKLLKYGKFNKDMDDKEFKAHLESLKSDFPESFTEKPKLDEGKFKTDTSESGKQLPKEFVSEVAIGNVLG